MIARRFLIVAATGALALALAGCGGPQTASTSSAGQSASASVAASTSTSAATSAATSAPASTSAATEPSASADVSASTAASPSASAPASPAAPAAEGITEQDAIAIALAHAGFAEGDVAFTKVGQDLDDGRNEWEIEFIVDATEYDYDIDAATGDIIAFDNEIEDDLVVQGPAPTADIADIADIGRDAAVAVALQDAGVTEADCIELEAEIDYDSSPQHYDVSFTAGGMEYDYDIDVATGDILTRSQEVDD